MDDNWVSGQIPPSLEFDLTANAPQSAFSMSSMSTTPLNPISCIVCRRRKVKCNRVLPSCSNCAKGETRCVYPACARASRRKQVNLQHLGEADNEATLLKRLKHLEGMVAKLGNHVETPERQESIGAESAASPASNGTEGITNDLGKLVVEQGQSRYISSQVWDNLIDEVEDIKDLYASTPGTDDYDSPKYEDLMGQSYFSAGNAAGFHSLRPMVSQISYYWHVFAESVDPLIKVIHQPTMDKSIRTLIVNQMKGISPEMEVFMFSVYFSVVMSMSPDDVFNSFGELKSVLAARYRHGFEQALAGADFLKTQELLVVQALILFLIFAKIDDQKYVWTMTATVVRIAQFMGLHRDGTTFGLPPFEVEMRRRVWWWTWALDLRTAEDYSTEPIISRTGFDTKLPLNIEDSDISLENKTPPIARQEFTAVSPYLMRAELMGLTTHDLYSQPMYVSKELGGDAPGSKVEQIPRVPTFEEMESSVDKCNKFLEEVWLPRCDVDHDPRSWLSVLMARIVIIKMRIFIYKPRPGVAVVRTQEVRDKLFTYTLEVIELENQGSTDPRAKRWNWWFSSMRQWGAMAFLVTELCIRKGSPDVARAWGAIDERLEIWNVNALEKQGLGQRKQSLWFPIKRILQKACSVRFNDEYLRAQDKHITKAILGEQGSSRSSEQPLPDWGLLDDFQIPMMNPESTLFGPYDPMILTNDWLAPNAPAHTDFTMPAMQSPNDPNIYKLNNPWQNL